MRTIISDDSGEPNRLFVSTVRAMRRSLDATEDQLARASGIGRQRLQTIETGGTTTRAKCDPQVPFALPGKERSMA